MVHFSKEFLEKYSAANYVAILAASEEAYRTGWTAPDKDKDPRDHVSTNTAAAAARTGADTAAREQTTMGEGAANNNLESNRSAPAEHAVLEPDKQQSQSRTVPAEGPTELVPRLRDRSHSTQHSIRAGSERVRNIRCAHRRRLQTFV